MEKLLSDLICPTTIPRNAQMTMQTVKHNFPLVIWARD
jgi:hypothetical protein